MTDEIKQTKDEIQHEYVRKIRVTTGKREGMRDPTFRMGSEEIFFNFPFRMKKNKFLSMKIRQHRHFVKKEKQIFWISLFTCGKGNSFVQFFIPHVKREEIFFNFRFRMKKKMNFYLWKSGKIVISWKKKTDFSEFLFSHVEREFFFSISHPACGKRRDFFEFPFPHVGREEIVFPFFFPTITLGKIDALKRNIMYKSFIF